MKNCKITFTTWPDDIRNVNAAIGWNIMWKYDA